MRSPIRPVDVALTEFRARCPTCTDRAAYRHGVKAHIGVGSEILIGTRRHFDNLWGGQTWGQLKSESLISNN